MTTFFIKNTAMKPALLIVDVQNDYFRRGKMELVEMEAACENVKNLLSWFRANNFPVVFIQHLAIRPNATFFIPETVGVEIHKSILPTESETVITKHFPNSFRETSLHDYLQAQNPTELVICGAMSHMCIDTTTRAAFDLGYTCSVIADACATRDLVYNDQKITAANVQLAYMAALNGTFAKVICTRQFLTH
jgi:nicotinamidase-related amidase